MKKLLTFFIGILFLYNTYGQTSDYIIIKKRNNRTIKTYFAGSLISAVTYNGFVLNGIIKAIRNDSIILQQQQTILTPTELGQKIDTISYMVNVYYNQIKKFNFVRYDVAGRKKGFSVLAIPKLLVIGGVGFIGLELFNTAYRQESLTQDNKLRSLGIAAGAVATGFIWNYISKNRNKVGGKYKVVYIKANAINNSK